MPQKSLILKILLYLPAFLVLTATLFLWMFSHEFWVDFLLDLADKKDWKDYFSSTIFTESRFLLLRGAALFFCLIFINITLIIYRYRVSIFEIFNADITKISSFISKVYRELTIKEKWFLIIAFAIFSGRAVFGFFYYELQYDEAWTFVHFSSKGMIVSALSPNNNHTLYTICSAFFYQLGCPAKLAVRLPAFLFASTALIAIFLSVYRHFGKTTALNATLILSTAIPLYFFSILGRGYSSMLLFTVLSSFSILLINGKNKNSGTFLRIFILSAVFGFYSNPVFFYVWLLNLFVFSVRNYANRPIYGAFLLSNLTVVFCVGVLYSPMIFAGGLQTLGAATETNIETSNTILYLNRLADWLFWGKGTVLFLPLSVIAVCLALFYVFFGKKENYTMFLWMQLYWIFPFAVFLLTSIEAPYRIWFWVAVFFWIQIVLLLNDLKIKPLLLNILLILIMSFNFYASQTHYFMNWSAKIDREAVVIAAKIMAAADTEFSCYCFSKYDKPLLDYYFLINKRSYSCFMPFKESRNYKPFESENYDAVLLDTEDYKATESELQVLNNNYKLIYENIRVKLYIYPN